MKKVPFKVLFAVAACLIAFQMQKTDVRAEGAGSADGDVILNEMNFPDASIRKALEEKLDTDKNGVLSKEERGKVQRLDISFGTDNNFLIGVWNTLQDGEEVYRERFSALYICINPSRQSSYNLSGIEYLNNLQEVRLDHFERMTGGSLKGNPLVKQVEINCDVLQNAQFAKVAQSVPLEQLTYLGLKNVDFDKIDLKSAGDLRILKISSEEESEKKRKIDLSNSRELRKLELYNVPVKKLDLRKNKKLTEVSVKSGEFHWGDKYGYSASGKENYEYYVPTFTHRCQILFPVKNNIKVLKFFTSDRKIDLSRLTKLEDLHLLKHTKAKVKRKQAKAWYNNKNWALRVVKSGKFMKNVKLPKKGKYVYL